MRLLFVAGLVLVLLVIVSAAGQGSACAAEAGTVIRDTSGRTVARVVREVGGGLAIRDTSGRTVARIKEKK